MIMYKKAYIVLLSTRIIKEAIMLPIQIVTMFALINAIRPITKKYLV